MRLGKQHGKRQNVEQIIGQTMSGGECMEQQEITLGQATYQISRVYVGTRSASNLLAERLAKRLAENPPFDGGYLKVV